MPDKTRASPEGCNFIPHQAEPSTQQMSKDMCSLE